MTAGVPLSAATLQEVGRRVPVPTYDRSAAVSGIVHLGVGGFHRAHQAVYVDRLLAQGDGDGWALTGVGVLPQDRRMADALRAQDGLYTVVVKGTDGSLHPQVVGSVVDYLLAPDDPETVVARLADPRTRIVSLTITEGGYAIAPDGGFDASAASVAPDLQPGAVPRSAFGLVTAALARRRRHRVPPFTVLSCDNVAHNGVVARTAFTGFAHRLDPELADWIEREVRFPSTMVDRITPVTAADDIVELERRFGVRDAWPVVCEPFLQWVVEDDFGPLGRPPLERVGAQLVDDVAPYELMKLRLLNASHQALAYLGYLCGYRYVDDTVRDPLFARFLRRYMEDEAMPTLRPVPGVDLPGYVSTLLERFTNPGVRDTLARICADTSDRVPKFLLPVVRDQLAVGGPVDLAALVVASWARYARGTDEDGAPVDVVDPLRDRLQAAALDPDPVAFLRVGAVFGDLADAPRFVAAYVAALDSLREHGPRGALDRALAG